MYGNSLNRYEGLDDFKILVITIDVSFINTNNL